MPTISDVYREELEERFETWEPEDEEAIRVKKLSQSIPEMRELWIAGEWLADKLRAAGADVQQVKDVCFAYGQRCFGSRDVWSIAEQALRKFEAGSPDQPGLKLAEEICREKMPQLFDR